LILKKFKLLGILLAGLLSGCGGGGSGPVGFDPSPFYGAWLAETTYCGSNAAQGTDGTIYSSIDKFVKLTETQYEFTADLYQGLTCDVKVGTLKLSTALKWSSANIAGKSIAASITIDPDYQETATLSNGSPIALRTNTGWETTEKTVLAIESDVLYIGDIGDTGVFDSDGFPTTVLRYGPKQ
jgi:hypothetical protein